MPEPRRLSKLIIQEVSAVDDPASELPGWAVAKAKRDRVRNTAAILKGFGVAFRSMSKEQRSEVEKLLDPLETEAAELADDLKAHPFTASLLSGRSITLR